MRQSREPPNAALQLRAHSTHLKDIVAARHLQALVRFRRTVEPTAVRKFCERCSISSTRRLSSLLHRDRGHVITCLTIRLIYLSGVFARILIRSVDVFDARAIVTSLMEGKWQSAILPSDAVDTIPLTPSRIRSTGQRCLQLVNL
jgi:hypothetical protein